MNITLTSAQAWQFAVVLFVSSVSVLPIYAQDQVTDFEVTKHGNANDLDKIEVHFKRNNGNKERQYVLDRQGRMDFWKYDDDANNKKKRATVWVTRKDHDVSTESKWMIYISSRCSTWPNLDTKVRRPVVAEWTSEAPKPKDGPVSSQYVLKTVWGTFSDRKPITCDGFNTNPNAKVNYDPGSAPNEVVFTRDSGGFCYWYDEFGAGEMFLDPNNGWYLYITPLWGGLSETVEFIESTPDTDKPQNGSWTPSGPTVTPNQ